MTKIEPSLNLTLCVPRPSSGLNLNEPTIVRSPCPAALPPNHVLIKVDCFGFSANNITYQALGEVPHFRYFDFHPAPTACHVSPKSHGIVPVWGFGTIELSTHPKIEVGERVYGYLAPTQYLVLPVSFSDVNKHAFYVPRPHLPADRRPYNQIIRCAADPQYSPAPQAEDLTMLYRPLFWTAFWCEDWLASSSYRDGARRVLISSASSKTAFCLAYCIRRRGVPGMRIVGLTSAKNIAFTRGLGLFDDVAAYDAFVGTEGGGSNVVRLEDHRWIYVDVRGDDAFNGRVFARFGAGGGRLVASIALGMTNLSPTTPAASSTDWASNSFSLSTPPASGQLEPFFMPEWLNVRKRQLSPADIFDMQNRAWSALMRDGASWVKIERVSGEDVKEAYRRMVAGHVGPERGEVWSLWGGSENLRSHL